jgi:hypothetical protein
VNCPNCRKLDCGSKVKPRPFCECKECERARTWKLWPAVKMPQKRPE